MANDKDFKIKNGLQLGGAFIEKVGTIAGNATLDLTTGNYFDYTPTADATFVFSNPPTGGNAQGFSVALTGADIGVSYDLANASYDSVSFSVAGQETLPRGLFFKPDGLKIYVVGMADDEVLEYNLSTAWDISTASYLQAFSVTAQETLPSGLFFKPDGTKMYIIGPSGDSVYEYSLSTAWDILSSSFVQSFSVAAQDTSPVELFFKSDGVVMYVLGSTGDNVYEYSLSTAWDISTASYSQNFSVAAQITDPQGLFFKPDGTRFYVVGQFNASTVYEYSLTTAWDISTASFVQSFGVVAQDTNMMAVSFKSDGSKMYTMGLTTDAIYQYSTGTGSDIATFTYPASVYWPSGTTPTAPADGETDLLTFYTDDGGATYYGIQRGDNMS